MRPLRKEKKAAKAAAAKAGRPTLSEALKGAAVRSMYEDDDEADNGDEDEEADDGEDAEMNFDELDVQPPGGRGG